jgi:hypothetical protein
LPRLGTSERVAPLCAQNAGLVWLDGVLAQVTVLSDALSGVNGQLSEVDEINNLVRRRCSGLAPCASRSACAQRLMPHACSALQVADASATISTLSQAANTYGKDVHAYARMFSLATTLIGAGFIGIGLLCVAAAALSSPRGATGAAILLWLILIVSWCLCGASYVATVAVKDACLALDGMVRTAVLCCVLVSP